MVATVAVVGPVTVMLWVFTVADVVATPAAGIRRLPKAGWLGVTLGVPVAGSVAWLVAGRPTGASGDPATRTEAGFSDYDVRELTSAMDLQAQEAFRRRCRQRAQEQRLRYVEQQRAAGPADGATDGAIG